MGTKIDQVAPNCRGGAGFCLRPAFPETTIITVSFGRSGFEKVILGMEMGRMLWFVCVLCAMCYITFSPFIDFHNTTVNVAPLSLPILEKIVPHFKECVCSSVGSLRLRVFCFVFSRNPCPPPPLGQIGPSVGRMWCHCWSMLIEVVEGRLFNEAA